MSSFQFKHFSVEQEQSPARITTDATVFASSLEIPPAVERILEIGTGTGVLALMLAQRYANIKIEALEINPIAFRIAAANFKNSLWHARIHPILCDFKDYLSDFKYDLIFSNPPFFHNNLQSEINQGKNIAYHTDALPFHSLAERINLNLNELGQVHIMLPPYEMSIFEEEMNARGLQRINSIELRHRPNSKILRLFNVFSRVGVKKTINEADQVFVRDENNNFHPSYISLMKDFLTIF